MTRSEEVRKHVLEQYISPARGRGLEKVTVRAGDVHSHFHWAGRVPSVCQALSSRKFQQQAGVELMGKTGPSSGVSTTVEFTYRLLDMQDDKPDQRPPGSIPSAPPPDASGRSKPPTLLDLFGIAKQTFRKHGGGERFLMTERADWGRDPWERFAIERAVRQKKGKSR